MLITALVVRRRLCILYMFPYSSEFLIWNHCFLGYVLVTQEVVFGEKSFEKILN